MSKETLKTIIKIILMILGIILLILGIVWINSKELDQKVENKIQTTIEGQSVIENNVEKNEV